jgi:hypothetical protein
LLERLYRAGDDGAADLLDLVLGSKVVQHQRRFRPRSAVPPVKNEPVT